MIDPIHDIEKKKKRKDVSKGREERGNVSTVVDLIIGSIKFTRDRTSLSLLSWSGTDRPPLGLAPPNTVVQSNDSVPGLENRDAEAGLCNQRSEHASHIQWEVYTSTFGRSGSRRSVLLHHALSSPLAPTFQRKEE